MINFIQDADKKGIEKGGNVRNTGQVVSLRAT